MHAKKKIAFITSLLSLLIFPLILPSFRPLYFAPFLVVSLYRTTLYSAFWRATTCGLIIDLFSPSLPLGVTPIIYIFVTLGVYRARHNFFEDNLTSLPLLTLVFSMLATFFQYLLFPLFGQSVSLSWRFIFTEGILMAGLDALFALILFTLPYTLWKMGLKFLSDRERASC